MRIRPRRMRRTQRIRDLAAEVEVRGSDLIQGHFVIDGDGGPVGIPSMPGIERQPIARLLEQVERDLDLGIRAALLFGVIDDAAKDPAGAAAYEGEPLVARAVTALKERFGDDLVVITDVCLCGYTSHGHCGVQTDAGSVDNDKTTPLLARMALAHAAAGADIVAPSDMMDGRVGVIREALDGGGHEGTGLLSYAAKFASAYYGPFREAAGSAPGKGDRRGYQMDPRAGQAAIRDALLDEAEGADMLMVKPALAYLDLIAAMRRATRLPVVCYNVSGEYSMVHLAAREGLVDLEAMAVENLTAMRRAGADRIITYHAREALQAGWLRP